MRIRLVSGVMVILGSLSLYPTAGHAEDIGVALLLETTKATYAQFEPVPVRYSLVNNSDTERTVPGRLDHVHGSIRFEIAAEDGQFRPYRTGIYACGFATAMTLKPGERLSSEMIMVTNGFGRLGRMNLEYKDVPVFPFSEPGAFRLRATYPLAASESTPEHPTLVSNTVEISIAPTSEKDREAFQFFSGPDEYAAAVGADGEVADLTSALQRWEEFVDRYRESVYTPAVQFQLGRLYLNGTGMEHPDPARASVHFRAAAESGATGLADDALLELAKSQVEAGRVEEAQEAVARLLEQFPDSEGKTEAIRLRDGLAKGWRTLRDIYGN